MPSGRAFGKLIGAATYPDSYMERLAGAFANMSRLELFRAAFFSHSTQIPTKRVNDRIDMVEFTFAASEMLGFFTVKEFTGWAEEFGHPDIEEQDSYQFYQSFKNNELMSLTIPMVHDLLEVFLNTKYPTPRMEIFSSFHAESMESKEYYLPALKVLNEDSKGVFWSPTFKIPWHDNELSAHHLTYGAYDQADFLHEGMSDVDAMKDCHCGIYASVNINELEIYLSLESNNFLGWNIDDTFSLAHRRLCIVEPYSFAAVFMARKGWKANRVFISEIVGETISPQDASNLLSMTWNRDVDATYLYSKLRS